MLKSLQYANELEMLGYSYSLPGFESCNKLELVKGIWRSQSNNPQALIVIARICMDFGIYQNSVWASLLQQMAKYSMVKTYFLLWACILVHCAHTFLILLTLYLTTSFEQSCRDFSCIFGAETDTCYLST
jgi:hypothetical protein